MKTIDAVESWVNGNLEHVASWLESESKFRLLEFVTVLWGERHLANQSRAEIANDEFLRDLARLAEMLK